MNPEARIREYYRALESEGSLESFFVEAPTPVKYGISETLAGFDAIAQGLREQRNTTTDWRITSHRLRAEFAGDTGWFSDEVSMHWRDVEGSNTEEWETRWSGTLLRRDDTWKFVRMHVSAAHDF